MTYDYAPRLAARAIARRRRHVLFTLCLLLLPALSLHTTRSAAETANATPVQLAQSAP